MQSKKVSGYVGGVMIDIRNVSLRINKKDILSNISMCLNEGNIYGLIGNNGSGKTMLMRCICGFVHPTKGEICVDGKIVGKDIDYLNQAGIILENPGFIGYFSGIKNLKLLASIGDGIPLDKIKETMILCGLNPELKLHVKKYSLGMRQRLGIAQAIMEDQPILILDEPFNGLDRQGVEDIRRLLLELKKKGKLILLTSHNREDIELLCDEVYLMESGFVEKFEKRKINCY